MTGKTRGGFLIIGSIIAFIGFLIPGLYGVSYDPPAHSAAAKVVLTQLTGFHSPIALGTTNAGVYNGFGGPLQDALHLTLGAIIVTVILGLLAPLIDYETGISWVGEIHDGLSVSSQLVSIGAIIWQFRSGGTPSQVTQKFIADLGGGQTAIDASHYLSASLGLGFVILFIGFLVGSIGAYSRSGCTLFILFWLVVGVVLIYTRVTTGVW